MTTFCVKAAEENKEGDAFFITAENYAFFLNDLEGRLAEQHYDSKMESDLLSASIRRLGMPGHYYYAPLAGREEEGVSYLCLLDVRAYSQETGRMALSLGEYNVDEKLRFKNFLVLREKVTQTQGKDDPSLFTRVLEGALLFYGALSGSSGSSEADPRPIERGFQGRRRALPEEASLEESKALFLRAQEEWKNVLLLQNDLEGNLHRKLDVLIEVKERSIATMQSLHEVQQLLNIQTSPHWPIAVESLQDAQEKAKNCSQRADSTHKELLEAQRKAHQEREKDSSSAEAVRTLATAERKLQDSSVDAIQAAGAIKKFGEGMINLVSLIKRGAANTLNATPHSFYQEHFSEELTWLRTLKEEAQEMMNLLTNGFK